MLLTGKRTKIMNKKTTLNTPETSSHANAEELNKRVDYLVNRLEQIQKVKKNLLKILIKNKPE